MKKIEFNKHSICVAQFILVRSWPLSVAKTLWLPRQWGKILQAIEVMKSFPWWGSGCTTFVVFLMPLCPVAWKRLLYGVLKVFVLQLFIIFDRPVMAQGTWSEAEELCYIDFLLCWSMGQRPKIWAAYYL